LIATDIMHINLVEAEIDELLEMGTVLLEV
jgi:hypothetical protein